MSKFKYETDETNIIKVMRDDKLVARVTFAYTNRQKSTDTPDMIFCKPYSKEWKIANNQEDLETKLEKEFKTH